MVCVFYCSDRICNSWQLLPLLLRRGGVVLVPCSYKFLFTFFIRLCIYSIESFILSVSYELSLSQMLPRGIILGFKWKIWKITAQNLLWANGYSKKLHGMLKIIFKDIGYVCFISIMKATRNTFNNILRKVGFRLEFWNLTLMGGGGVSMGVFCMIQILIKEILRKVGN